MPKSDKRKLQGTKIINLLNDTIDVQDGPPVQFYAAPVTLPQLKPPKSKRMRELSFDPALLRRAKLKRRETNVEMMRFFGVKDEGTVSRWLNGRANMTPVHAKDYDRYIETLTEDERRA